MTAIDIVTEKTTERVAPALSVHFIPVNSPLAPAVSVPHKAALNVVPALFVVSMLLVVVILGVIGQAPIVVSLAGIAVALVTVVFAFMDLYIRVQKEN